MIRLTDEQWERIRDHFPEEIIIRSLIEACDDTWQQRFLPIVIGFIGPLSGHMRTMIC